MSKKKRLLKKGMAKRHVEVPQRNKERMKYMSSGALYETGQAGE